MTANGQHRCQRLQRQRGVPAAAAVELDAHLMLSHTSDEDQVIETLGAGANDYIGKPFRPRELVARLEAHMRRTSVEDNEPVLVLSDGVRIDLAARRVHRDDDEIKLTAIEYRLLSALLRARGRLLTHDDLMREVWAWLMSRTGRPFGPTSPTSDGNSLHRKRAGSSEHTRASDTCSITAPASLRRSSLQT
jgi:DNA-binding response OmpR family regulator